MLCLQGLFWLYIAYRSGAPLDWGAALLLLLGSTLVLAPIRRALGRAMGTELDANMTLRFMVVLFLAGSLFFYFSSQNFTPQQPTTPPNTGQTQQPNPGTPPRNAEMRDAGATDTTPSPAPRP